MKNYIIPLCFLFFSIVSFGQTESDYTVALDLIRKAFNEKNVSLVYRQFKSELKSEISEEKLKESFKALYIKQGAISGYELILDEKDEKYFLVEFDNSSMLLIIKLSPNKEISKFKIKEY